MKSSQTSTSKRTELIGRTTALAEVMMDDPARPWFLVEYALLLLGVAELLDDVLDAIGKTDELSNRLSSLETRYSELLYRLKSN